MASRKYPLSIFDVAAALKKRYRDFNHYNLKDPLNKLLFIICNTKTGRSELPQHLPLAHYEAVVV